MPTSEPVMPSQPVADDVSTEPILSATELVKTFSTGRAGLSRTRVRAVDGVDLTLQHSEALGIVGESGCGKSTLARMLVGLERPDSGQVRYDGRNITRHRRSDRKLLRSGVQMVFQDPYTSLDPRLTVMEIVGEPLAATRTGKRPHRRNRVAELLGLVGLSADMMERYPHQFSGGQRQRIGVARALALRPEILVCDEPVSALDVSVQAQVINLLSDLRRRLGLALVFIAHDLSVVQHVADRVAVMYLGQVVEHGTTSTVYERPAHPYTQALLSASPVVDRSRRGRMSTRIVLAGDPPSPSAPPSGCRFHTRCRMSKGECVVHEPILRKPKDDEGTRTAACHFSEDALTRLDEVFPADRPPDSPPT